MSGYLNPSAKTATVTSHSVTPTRMTDLLSKETIDLTNSGQVNVPVPCGLFRFLDVELRKEL